MRLDKFAGVAEERGKGAERRRSVAASGQRGRLEPLLVVGIGYTTNPARVETAGWIAGRCRQRASRDIGVGCPRGPESLEWLARVERSALLE